MSNYIDDYLGEDDTSQEEPVITFPICCTDVPDSLFDDNGTAAREHFEKFGIITKILLRPSKKSCIIEYERRDSAERAILNGGAYDGFMFNVTWNKDRKRPKVDNDPEWLPDPDVEEELKAMSRDEPRPPRVPRQKKMELDKPPLPITPKRMVPKPGVVRKKTKPIEKNIRIESPPVPTVPLQPIDREEIRTLMTRPWLTASDKLKALEIRDRIIRARLSARKGAIQGCCPDMCPERERLVRNSQRQVASYEFDDETGTLDAKKAVKQYSRSSADQEEPLAHELRPIPVLQDTLLYLLNYIVDSCQDESSLGDWFHFMWDRLRAIRKDITQQNLTCEGSVALVESCARFHAHCAARLVEEPPSSFDQRLNTENLLKCLQTLKYMYGDLRAKGQEDACRREPEFRAYVILLNMHDANFMWEVQRLDSSVLSSPEVRFAIKVFTALDNNHYIQFFKLVKETTYLNACILLRYFNSVRARALHRIIKTYSPRGSSQFPAQELMEMLAFESLGSMELFLENYGLQVTSDQHFTYIMLNKNTFHDNDTPSIQERAINLVESKLETSLGDVIYGDVLPESNFDNYTPHSSFNSQGYFNSSALLAQDQGCEPRKETLDEIMNIVKNLSTVKKAPVSEIKPFESNVASDKRPSFVFTKPDIPKELPQSIFSKASSTIFKRPQDSDVEETKSSFQRPGGFVFSEPGQAQSPATIFSKALSEVDSTSKANIFKVPASTPSNIFEVAKPPNSNPFGSTSTFTAPTNSSIFGIKPSVTPSDVFKMSGSTATETQNNDISSPSSLFKNAVAQQFITQIKEKEEEEKRKAEEEMKRKREEEARRKEEEARRKKEEEDRKIQEKIKEEMRKQQEIKRKIEEEKRKLEEAKRKAEEEKRAAELARQKAEFEKKERERKQKELEIKIEEQVTILVPEIVDEVVKEQCRGISKDAILWLTELHESSDKYAEELITEMCRDECLVGIKSAMKLREIRLRIICRSVIRIWRHHVGRSRLRWLLLHTTPTWLPMRPPPKAEPTQKEKLQRMRDFHRGKIPVLSIPEPRKNETINLFKTVKRTLFQQSQQINKNNPSLVIYWKVVTSISDSSESSASSTFFSKWIDELFSDEQVKSKPEHVLYLSENHKISKFVISVCNVQGGSQQQPYFSEKINGWNGVLFYGETLCLQNLTKRIENLMASKCPYEMLPIAIVVVLNSKSNALVALENTLELYKESRAINHYKIFQVTQMKEDLLCSASKAAFNWLAKYLPPNPCIKGDLLTTFLDNCLGSELWYRFHLAQKSSVRKAFENIEIVTHLYNEAVDRTVEIACNKSLINYPIFASEFKNFVTCSESYPKDYQYISPSWKSNLKALEDILKSFKIKAYFLDVWPPTSFESFQESLTKYVNKLNWFKNPEQIVLKTLSVVKENDNLSHSYSWLEIMNTLIKFKIIETNIVLNEKKSSYKRDSLLENFIVVYQQDDLSYYRSTPWWYSSKYTQSICPEIVDLPDDDSDLEFDHLDKKMKLDDSLQDSRILDDDWLNNVLLDIDTSINKRISCKNLLFGLDETLESEKRKQDELKRMLQAALTEG